MTEKRAPAFDVLRRISKVAGEDAARLMAKEFGGLPFHLPKPESLTDDHRLVELIGLKRAQAVCNEIGYGEVRLPRGPFSLVREARARALEMLAEGASHATIALETNLHIRTVEKLASQRRHGEIEKRQLRFF